jgi:hypothetical protein
MGNSNHDERGRFSSGSDSAAGKGDHAAVSPHPALRNVSGRTVPRSKPITRHAGVQSVGTDAATAKPRFIATAGGLKPVVPTTGLRPAAAEKARMNEAVDRRHYPNNNKEINSRLRASASPVPRTQPSAGQLVAAKIITRQ